MEDNTHTSKGTEKLLLGRQERGGGEVEEVEEEGSKLFRCTELHLIHLSRRGYRSTVVQINPTWQPIMLNLTKKGLTCLLLGEAASEELDSVVLERDPDVKDVHLVAPLQQLLHHVSAQEATPTHHSTHLALHD